MAIDLVTGAFSYTGRFLTESLLSDGHEVRTLTDHPRRELFGDRVVVHPLRFDRDFLAQVLSRVDTIYNTYWIRFPYGDLDFQAAVRNSTILIRAAREAGVRRFVHVSIANPSLDSPHPYYRGKAAVEQEVTASSLSYAIVRPTVLYGEGDVLMNNIAWFIRHLPVFGIPGSGRYHIQPAFVRDHVALMRRVATLDENVVLDSIGPDRYTFEGLLRMMSAALHRRTLFVKLPAPLVLGSVGVVGAVVHDVILTDHEVGALMDDLLVAHGKPTCPTRFDTWLQSHADELGHRFASELGRHFRSGVRDTA